MAKTGPWMIQLNRQDLNWFVTITEDQRYDRSCYLQDAATEDDGPIDTTLQSVRTFLERRITALPPPDEPNTGNTWNPTGTFHQGSPIAAVPRPQHTANEFLRKLVPGCGTI